MGDPTDELVVLVDHRQALVVGRGEGLDRVREAILARLPEGPAYFPPDYITEQPERFLAAEIVREQILRQTREEVPHSVAVVLGSDQPDAKASMLTISRDGTDFLLLQIDPRPAGRAGDRAAQQLGLAHIEIMVDNVDQMAAAIGRLGGTVLKESRSRLSDIGAYPMDIVFCGDPDGTLIVLVTDHDPAASKPH